MSFNSSETEQEVGTWIDGKKLYQITYKGTAPTVSTDGTMVIGNLADVSQLSINKIISFDGIYEYGGFHPINAAWNVGSDLRFLRVYYEASTQYIKIQTNRSILSGANVICTILYTKN